jgi:hypothetical protein
VGACSGNTGTETCTAGVWGGDTCDPLAGATAETCNNIDDNCDGTIDGISQATNCGVGECAGNTGTETCTAGAWGGDTCDPLDGATAEVCDNLDNDCDGQIDEGLVCQLLSTSVNPSDAGIINPDCSEGCTYDYMDLVVLNAIEDNGYPFNKWIDCDTPSNDICTMTIDDDKNVTAEFDLCMYPARVLGTVTDYYWYFQDALSNALPGNVIESQEYAFSEDIIFNNAAFITLNAGCDCSYSTDTGITTINGNMTINNGSITIQSGTLEVQ